MARAIRSTKKSIVSTKTITTSKSASGTKKSSLEVSDNFEYEMIVYLMHSSGVSLADIQRKNVKKFNGFSKTEYIIIKDKRYMKCVDLMGAPLDFLKEHNLYDG